MAFRKPETKSEWVNCSKAFQSTSKYSPESQFCAGENNDWVDCSVRTKNPESDTTQQGTTLQMDHDVSESFPQYNRNIVENLDDEVKKAQNSLDILYDIPESSDYIGYMKKKSKDMINTAIEESTVKKLLKSYIEKHNVTEKTLPLLRLGKIKLTKSVSAPCSPPSSHEITLNKKNANWSNCEDTEEDQDIWGKSIGFASLTIMVTALAKEKGSRPEAPFFIRSLCRDIMRAMLLIRDDITEDIETIIGNAASLIADMVQKDLEPGPYRGYSLEDIGIVDLIENVLECILDPTRISQFSGGRNNFVHNVIRNLIPSEDIRKIILDRLYHAIKRSYNIFYCTFERADGCGAIIPPTEINGLFHYFQLLTMVILCSSEEPWIEASDVEKIKELERIAKTKLPLHLVAAYATRTAVYALKYEKKCLEPSESEAQT